MCLWLPPTLFVLEAIVLVTDEQRDAFWKAVEIEGSWEEGADAALTAVDERTDVIVPPQARLMKAVLETGNYGRVHQAALWELRLHGVIGSNFFDDLRFVENVVLPLLAMKQHDYGHDNINLSGIEGVNVRIIDKWSRYENLMARTERARNADCADHPSVSALNESITDTLVDIIGYCIIATMLQQGTFDRPLAADMAAANDGADTPEGEDVAVRFDPSQNKIVGLAQAEVDAWFDKFMVECGFDPKEPDRSWAADSDDVVEQLYKPAHVGVEPNTGAAQWLFDSVWREEREIEDRLEAERLAKRHAAAREHQFDALQRCEDVLGGLWDRHYEGELFLDQPEMLGVDIFASLAE